MIRVTLLPSVEWNVAINRIARWNRKGDGHRWFVGSGLRQERPHKPHTLSANCERDRADVRAHTNVNATLRATVNGVVQLGIRRCQHRTPHFDFISGDNLHGIAASRSSIHGIGCIRFLRQLEPNDRRFLRDFLLPAQAWRRDRRRNINGRNQLRTRTKTCRGQRIIGQVERKAPLKVQLNQPSQ